LLLDFLASLDNYFSADCRDTVLLLSLFVRL
jgi:hypothetical protein